GIERLPQAAETSQAPGHLRVDIDQVRIIAQDLATKRNALDVTALLIQRESLLDAPDDGNVVTRVPQRSRGWRSAREIPERREARPLLGVRASLRLEIQRNLGQASGQRARIATLLLADVVTFMRIIDDVEQLRRGALDIVLARIGERAQLAPSEVQPRIESLAVDRALRSGVPSSKIDQRHPRQIGWCFRSD